MVRPRLEGKEEFHALRARRHLEEAGRDHKERPPCGSGNRGDVRQCGFQGPLCPFFFGAEDTYSEKDLENAILAELQKFILEMGAH